MTNVLIILLTFGIIGLSKWLNSTFIEIMSGMVSVATGVYWISLDPTNWIIDITGAAIVVIGFYILIMVAMDFFKGE